MTIGQYACRCNKCPREVPEAKLAFMMGVVENHFGEEIYITSGHRCSVHNAKFSKYRNSYHVRLKALDFVVSNVDKQDVYDFIDTRFPNCGLIIYNTKLHMDSRSHRYRDDKRT